MQEYGIKWEKEYELGNERVDSQHKKLFELLSELIEACENGTETEKVYMALDFLVNYTVQHFHDEEALQTECGFPEYERHKQLHEDFKGTVSGLVRKFDESGSSVELLNDINRVLVRWLLRHIQAEDKKIGAYMASKSMEMELA